jgi:cytochrome c biogenesis protein CcmG/thiol:disulfide interchange protein DsbE
MQAVKTDRILQVLFIFLLTALLFVVADSFREKLVNVGYKAPGFTVTADNGRQITSSQFGGKLLLLNFWATWCPPCIEEMPSLNELQKRLGPSGLVVLGISVDKSEGAYREFLRKVNVSFLTARDPTAAISSRYGTYKYPESYLIDRNGKVVEKQIGATNWTDEEVFNQIKAML